VNTKKKRTRLVKPAADAVKILKEVLAQINSAESNIYSAWFELEEVRDDLKDAGSRVEAVAEVIRERIEKLESTKRPKKG